jgi:cytochrome c
VHIPARWLCGYQVDGTLSRRDSVVRTAILSILAILTAQLIQARAWAGAGLQAGNAQNGEQLTKESDCSSCHAADREVVGPAYSEIAKKYAGQSDAADKLAQRVKDGGSGNWGNMQMPPHYELTDAQRQEIVRWILSLKDTPAAQADSTGAKKYDYTTLDGKTVTLDFPLFVEGKEPKVTKNVFRGYELYNSYCFRCHGTDATESELAPNLRHSMDTGMTAQQFLAVAMPGRDDKGMPSWAGFLTEEEMTSIYRYVKGRSLGLVPVGRPPSESE